MSRLAMWKRPAIFLPLAVFGLIASGVAVFIVTARATDPFVSFQERVPASQDSTLDSAMDPGALRFAIASMFSAEGTFENYRSLVQYVGLRLGSPSVMVLRPGYHATRTLIEQGKVQVAFVCTGTYVHSLEAGLIDILVRPVPAEGLTYHCAVIVPAHSRVHARGDLKGRSFAFTDPESLTGYLVPRRWLSGEGVDPDKFLGEIVFTGSHDRSVMAVARGSVEAASVDSLVLASIKKSSPEIVARTRVLWRSEPFGEPPVVVAKGIDPATKEKLAQIFLNMHETPSGRFLLKEIQLARFVPAEHADYASAVELYRASPRAADSR